MTEASSVCSCVGAPLRDSFFWRAHTSRLRIAVRRPRSKLMPGSACLRDDRQTTAHRLHDKDDGAMSMSLTTKREFDHRVRSTVERIRTDRLAVRSEDDREYTSNHL